MKAYQDDRDWKLKAVLTDEALETVRARDLMREIAQAAWECADPGMQYDTTINEWHTCPASRAHQREQPVQRVHAPRQQRVQPRQPEPAEVPGRGRQLRHPGVQARRRGRVHRAGDHRGQLELPHREDRAEREGVPPARPGLREPRRAAHGARAALRLRRRAGLGRRHHRAHDRPRLPDQRDGSPSRPGRSPATRRTATRCCGSCASTAGPPRTSTRNSFPRGCFRRPRRRGTRRSPSASSTDTATRRRRCWRRPARSA